MRGTLSDVATLAAIFNGYHPADSDGASPAYDGFLNRKGEWYILKTTTTGDVDAYTYFKGDSAYATGWTDRATHAYATFDSIFK